MVLFPNLPKKVNWAGLSEVLLPFISIRPRFSMRSQSSLPFLFMVLSRELRSGSKCVFSNRKGSLWLSLFNVMDRIEYKFSFSSKGYFFVGA